MKRLAVLLLIAGFVVFTGGLARAQEKQSKKTGTKSSPAGEIQLDALHVEAHIEKPSVSIVSRRIEPELQEVEFILRNFDQELREVPRSLFVFQGNRNRIEPIRNRDLDRLLRSFPPGAVQKSQPERK